MDKTLKDILNELENTVDDVEILIKNNNNFSYLEELCAKAIIDIKKILLKITDNE